MPQPRCAMLAPWPTSLKFFHALGWPSGGKWSSRATNNSASRRTQAVAPERKQGVMTNGRDLLPLVDGVCERIGQRLDSGSLDRHALLDLATALTIVADMLHRADQDMRGYEFRGGTLSIGRALYQLDECVGAVRRDRASAPDEVIREYVEGALHHARRATTILRRREAV